MAYTLKDVDDAEAMVLAERPSTLVERGDFDWSLSIRDKDSTVSVILFRPQIGDEPEIASTPEQIMDICFWLGSQWTVEEAAKLSRKWPGGGYGFNRIQ